MLQASVACLLRHDIGLLRYVAAVWHVLAIRSGALSGVAATMCRRELGRVGFEKFLGGLLRLTLRGAPRAPRGKCFLDGPWRCTWGGASDYVQQGSLGAAREARPWGVPQAGVLGGSRRCTFMWISERFPLTA